MTADGTAPSAHAVAPSPSGEAVEFVGQLGLAMLAAGYAVTDVQTTLNRTATAVGVPGASIATLPSGVLVDASGASAKLFNQTLGSLRWDQSCEVGQLAAEATTGKQSIPEMSSELDEVLATPPRYPKLFPMIGSALQSGGIAVVFGTSVVTMVTAAILGFLVGAALIWSGKYPRISSVMPMVCGFVVGLIVLTIGNYVGLGHSPLYAVAAPMVMLIPGATITNGVIELAAGDMVAGSARIASGLLIWASLALGVVGAAAITQVNLLELSQAPVDAFPAWAPWIALLAMAVGLGFFFSADLRLIVVMAIVLEVTYALISVLEIPWNSIVATGVAAALVLPLCRILEGFVPSLPTIVTFRPAFWLCVPGSMGLVTLTDVATSQPNTFTLVGAVIGTVIAIAVGVQVGAFIAQLIPFRR